MSKIIVFIITTFSAMLPLVEIRGALPLGMSSVWGDGALSSTLAWLACILGGTLICFIAVAIFIYLRKRLERYKFFQKMFSKTDLIVLKFACKSRAFKFKKRVKVPKEKTKNSNTTFENNESANNQPNTKDTLKNRNSAITFENSNTASSKPNTKKALKKTKNNGEWKKFMLVFIFCALPIPFSGVWTAAGLCSILQLSYLKSVLALSVANIVTGVFIYLFCTILAEYIDVVLVILILIMIFALIYKGIALFVEKRSIKKEEQS